ncbi:MAG: membrane dipeptidase [Chloroflexi bacterium]|nr:membrane dipeptidase [Chloroflexota bacterium]
MTASSLHQHSFVFDAHCDTLGAALPGPGQRDLRHRGSKGHLDVPRLQAGGINCQIFAAFPGKARLQASPTAAVLERVHVLHDLIALAPEDICLIQTAADLAALRCDGPIGAILSLEGVEALVGRMSLLHIFHRLGVRNIGLTWNHRNAAADGVQVGSQAGLTAFGRELVATCNQIGIMLDLSHLNPAGVADVLALSHKPVIASHSNADALCPHPRNLTDDQLRGVAANGGVVGVTFVREFISPDPAAATLERMIDHIDHIVQVAGIDHVGIGSDFDGCNPIPELSNGEHYPRISEGLSRRGYTPAHIQQILGENFRRVFLQTLPTT